MARGRSHWSHGSWGARFLGVSAFVCIPLLALLLFPSWKMLYVTVAVVAFFVYVELVKKMTPMAYLRSLNIVLTGRVKAARNLFKELKR